MKTASFKGKDYIVDKNGFLLDMGQWDRNFAEGMAREAEIEGGLTATHWEVISFIREFFEKKGVCPLVYQTCKSKGLSIVALKRLFPTGYLRGACKLAGITYSDRLVNYFGEEGRGAWVETASRDREEKAKLVEKIYRVDVRGFLVDPSEWDENFARNMASEMRVSEELTENHWKIIYYLRNSFKKKGAVPTVYETCEANGIELQDLEELFPYGYHRGAVKIAGLRVK